MTHVLLVGEDVALLEGLAQSLAAQGHAPAVATSLAEVSRESLIRIWELMNFDAWVASHS